MRPGRYEYDPYVVNDAILKVDFQVIENGTTKDITDYDITATFRRLESGSEVIKTVGNGITITDGPQGSFRIDQFSLDEVGDWYYDIQIKQEQESLWFTIIQGKVEILSEISV